MNAYLAKNPRLVVWLLCFILLSVRAYERLIHDGLWAEDALQFLREGLTLPLSTSLLNTFGGYYHTLPKLLTRILLLFPITWFARLVFVVCIAIQAWVISRLMAPTYSYLVSKQSFRLALCICLCFFPAMHETLGNFANLHFTLFLWLAFVGLKDPRESLTPLEILGSVFVSLSAGESVTLLPLFAWRIWRLKHLKSENRYPVAGDVAVVLVVLFGAFFNIAPSLANSKDHPTAPNFFEFQNLVVFVELLKDFFLNRIALNPLVGNIVVWRIAQSWGFLGWIVGFALAWFLGQRLWKRLKLDSIPLFLACTCAFGVLFLTWLVRPEALYAFQTTVRYFHKIRYSFLAGNFALLVWFAALEDWSLPRWFHLQKPRIWFSALVVAGSIPRLFIESYEAAHNWYAVESRPLDAALKEQCPDVVTVPANPQGWMLVLDLKQTRRECSK